MAALDRPIHINGAVGMTARENFRFLTRMAGFAERHKIAVSGDGEDTVLLGNGFGTNQECWRALLPWLETHGRVIRFDWAIHPDHFDVTRYSELDGFVDDMLAVIEATAVAPCVLIGHSMSAMIGMLATKREPSFFRRIAMIAPAPRYSRDSDYAAGFSIEEIEGLLDRISDDYLAWTAAFAPIAVGEATGAFVDDFREGLRAMRPDIAFTMARVLFSMDLRAGLGDYTTPTTIIQPIADPVVPVSIGRYLAECWPQAELNLIETTGHLPHVTAPDQVKRALTRVLSDCAT
jgi:sigma-B regulation protein RsbQ